MRRCLASILLAQALWLAGCEAPPPNILLRAAEPGVNDVAPDRMRAALAAGYRLAPDRRFLLAIARTHQLLTNEPATTPQLTYIDQKTGGSWHIRYRDQEVAANAELADFPVLIDTLMGWARRLAGDRVATALGPLPCPAPLYIADGAAALIALDRRWRAGDRDAARYADAASAATWLALQGLDRLEMADDVPAHALALLATARALTVSSLVPEEALLAYRLGYTAQARRLGETLASDDPVRAFVMGSDAHLAALAAGKNAPPLAAYLHLLRVADRGDWGGWLAWQQAHAVGPGDPPLAVLKTGLALDRPEPAVLLGHATLASVQRAVGEANGHPDQAAAPEGLVRKVVASGVAAARTPYGEAAVLARNLAHLTQQQSVLLSKDRTTWQAMQLGLGLEAIARQDGGPFADGRVLAAHYRAVAYSAWAAIGQAYLETDAARATDFARGLGGRPGVEADFRTWYTHLVRIQLGQNGPGVFLDDLQDLTELGGRPLMRSMQAFGRSLDPTAVPGSPDLARAARELTRRLDARPSQRQALASVARTWLADLPLAERLATSALAARGGAAFEPALATWLANFKGKVLHDLLVPEGLAGLADGPAVLEALANRLPAPADRGRELELERAFKEVLASRRGDWAVMRTYLGWLEGRQAWSEAQRALAAWLSDESIRQAGPDAAAGRAAMARILAKLGDGDAAWRLLSPDLAVENVAALARAARLREAQGRPAEATALALRALASAERRATSSASGEAVAARTLVVELAWRHGQTDAASAALAASAQPWDPAAWQALVAPAFHRAFVDRPASAVEAAIAPLAFRNPPEILLDALVAPFERDGRPERAFRLRALLAKRSPDAVAGWLAAYQAKKAWQGQVKAIAWLAASLPEAVRPLVPMAAFEADLPEVLWTPDLTPVPDADLWLLRAAAATGPGVAADPGQRSALRDVYGRKIPSDAYPDTVGRHLAGFATEASALAVATTVPRRCEVAYFLGRKARGEGRYADAITWYRVAVETGAIDTDAHRRARESLARWQALDTSPSRLTPELEKAQPPAAAPDPVWDP